MKVFSIKSHSFVVWFAVNSPPNCLFDRYKLVPIGSKLAVHCDREQLANEAAMWCVRSNIATRLCSVYSAGPPGHDKSNDGNTRSLLTWDEGLEQVKLLQNSSSSKFPDLEFRLQGTFLYDLGEHSVLQEITWLYGADFSTFQHF